MEKRILVIDDDNTSLQFIGGVIKPFYEISMARSGEGGLKIMQNPNATIGLIILDINMPPGMNGFEVLENMEALGIEIPVIMLTSERGGKKLKEAENSDLIMAYIVKPPDPTLLLDKVEKSLLRWRREAAERAWKKDQKRKQALNQQLLKQLGQRRKR
jgi:response regulator RpfG family c-di-GMP phosphodiesterase